MPPRYTMSDSEEDEDEMLLSKKQLPTDKQLENALRDTVASIFKKGNLDDLTVKRVRAVVENAMGLDEGYFKGHEKWKPRSDQIIKDEVDKQQNAQDETERLDHEKPSSPPHKKEPPPKQKPPAKRTAAEDPKKSSKRRKTQTPSDNDSLSSPLSDLTESEVGVSKGAANKTKSGKAAKPKPEDSKAEESSDNISIPGKKEERDSGSESELSVPLDEAPKPKRKHNKEKLDKKVKKPKAKGATKANADLDPDQAEIKRLQGWLLKCGIRKVWSRELAAYDTPKAKVRHLREMLEDAGMKGRYSLEKAKQIKEERELKADLEMVQEGARRWGTGSGGEEIEDEKPRRRIARGLQNLAFLSDEGEETD